MTTIRHFFLASVLALWGLGAGTTAAAETIGKVMIVLDASGSMWGQIDGEAKIDIARATVRDLLEDWDPKLELGLAAYGHRHKGRCDDIETLIPVGTVTPEAIMTAVNALQPKGKTPLSEAVRHAAEELKYMEERATVILVSDGKETCNADPCALGRSLEEKGIDFTAFVIGFDIESGEEVGLECLADNTGGKFYAAEDAKSLSSALKTTVTEVKKAAVAKPQPEPARKQVGTKLIALYAAGGKEYEGDINWRVLEPERDLDGQRKHVASTYRGESGHIFRDLEPGRYVVVGELSDHRQVRREFEIEVKTNQAAVYELVFDMGRVRFDALLAKGGPAFKDDLIWRVLAPEAGLDGKRTQLANFYRVKSGSIFILPAGVWRIEGVLADQQHVKFYEDISVAPGGEEAHAFVFNAGRVRFDALLAKGGPAFKDDLIWRVLAPEAGLDGKRTQLANFYRVKSGSIFVLPAGVWRIEGVLADQQHVKFYEDISVAPGGEEVHTFVFNAGAVRVDVTKDGKPTEQQIRFTFWREKQGLDTKRQKVANFYRVKSGTVAILPEGDYVLTAADPDAPTYVGETTVSVRAGGESVARLDLREP